MTRSAFPHLAASGTGANAPSVGSLAIGQSSPLTAQLLAGALPLDSTAS